ncbi:hypothetical protein ACFL10_00695 [Patescibacteria group bacterium]
MVCENEQGRPEATPAEAEVDDKVTKVDEEVKKIRTKKDRIITVGSNFLSPPY